MALTRASNTSSNIIMYGATGLATLLETPNPVDVHFRALEILGFKKYTLYDQSINGTKIKYFLAQGHPVIAKPGLLTGYDDIKEIFFVCDPKLGEAIEIPYKDFPRRQAIEWADTSKLVRRGEIIYPKE